MLPFIQTVTNAFRDDNLDYAVVGGHAVALHGAVRGTVDVDIIIKWTENTLIRAEQILLSLGLVSRVPITATDIFLNRDQYVKEKNLIAWNFYNPQNLTEQVDLIIIHDLAQMNSKKIKLLTGEIIILDIDDLIRIKKMSGRPQDLEDIRALELVKKNRGTL